MDRRRFEELAEEAFEALPGELLEYVDNVVFPTSVLADGATGRIAIYYGATDTYTALAYAYADEILDYVKANHA